MRHAEILHRCFRCGYCKLPGDYSDLSCPSYLRHRFESFSPGGRMWLLRAWLNNEIETSDRLGEILFSCAACGNCVEHCAFPEFKSDLLHAFTAGREELVSQGAVPPAVRDCFKAVQIEGNPFKLPGRERGAWAKGLGLNAYDGQEYLFYVGCVGSYDEQGREMARAVASLLKKLGLSFGIMGADELCDGNEIKYMGEAGLFEQLAKQNIAAFQARGVQKIVTLSPHGYNAIKNDYPWLGGQFEVSHYSQVLAALMEKQSSFREVSPFKVAFHDPCYLGRHNWEYQAPRRVLEMIEGAELVEMERSMANSLCCGGGGGNFFTDVLGGGQDSPSRVRVTEAARMGVDVLAVACPTCAKMLEDAVKAEDLDERLRVTDLAEIVLEGSSA